MDYHLRSENIAIEKRDRLFLLLIVILNLLIKAIPAEMLELGNDEVYYWTYAMFPDWSHFDHPPMVGLLIQLFSINLTLQSEFFIRAGALVLSSVNIILLFYLVKSLYPGKAPYFAAVIYISSFYFNVLSGLFILPDTPQIFFVLLAFTFLLPSITKTEPDGKVLLNIFLFGLFTGLAFLSKYHSLFLWFGAGLYIIFHNRTWLRKPVLYLGVLATIILSLPVIYWNVRNDFISFDYHSSRVDFFNTPLNFISFITFSIGQFLYQNPVLSVIYILTVCYNLKRRHSISQINIMLLYLSLPMILLFTFFSLFRNIFPHWSGPAFLSLIILSSEYLSGISVRRNKLVVRVLSAAAILFIVSLYLSVFQINTGLLKIKTIGEGINTGRYDFTLDMFGWKQAKERFSEFLAKENISEKDYRQVAIITERWFPAAHIDYYIAHPLGIRLVALGNIERIHKYYWINRQRKLNNDDRIFYITDSRNYNGPERYEACFSGIIPKDTLPIKRNNKTVKYIYIYDMTGLKCDTMLYTPHPDF